MADDVVEDLRARMGTVGLWTAALDGMTVDEARAFSVEVEDQGAGSLWYGEAYGRNAFLQAQLALADTSSLVVGSSIANIWGRDAFAARSAQATLGALHPGRFVMGLGVSHAPMVERLRGHEYGRPLATMRTYLEALDARDPVVADAAPSRPRMVAALGPKMLALSAELADGALPYLTLPHHTAQAREIVGPDKALVVEAGAVISGDVDTWRDRAHQHLEIYTGLPNYRNSWIRQGFTEADAPRGGSERLKSALVTHGLDATLERIQEHLDAGADHVAVQVLADQPLTVARDDVATLLAATRERWPSTE